MEEVRAIVKARPGAGAELVRMAVPEMGPKDIMVKVKAAAICGTDLHIYDWTPYAQARVKPPMVFGHEFCGEVVAVGPNVSRVKVGDMIAGETHIPCGHCFLCDTGLQHICDGMRILGVHVPGAFAEVIVIPETVAWTVPRDIPPLVGAILEPVGVGVHAAYSADVRGASILVTGCGPIGIVAIGMSRALGAKLIIATDLSEQRLTRAKEYGADVILNPTVHDVVETCRKLTSGLGVDVCIEASGATSAIRHAFSSARRAGQVVLFGLPGRPVEIDLVDNVIYKEVCVKGITGREMWRTWYQVMDVLSSGVLDIKHLVTDELPMSRFEEGFAIAKAGNAGKVVLYPSEP